MKKLLILMLFVFIFCGGSDDTNNSINPPNTDVIEEESSETEETTQTTEKIIESDNENNQVEQEKDENIGLTFVQSGECYNWVGSENFSECIYGSQVTYIEKYDNRINNLVPFEDDIFVIIGPGKIFKFDGEKSSLFLDIEDKVRFEIDQEAGLFDISIHPSKDYALISYSDLDNVLVVEKYSLDSNLEISNNSTEIILEIPNSQCCHWSGDIIWSNFFQDFLIGVGDMEENDYSFINSEPLDTTSRRGKIMFLNSDKNFSKPPLISETNLYEPRTDILAYGLRNPWKLYEYKNLLFVPDIGFASSEELNIINLKTFNETKEPFLFGWPLYEGSIKNEIDTAEVFYWNNGVNEDIFDFVYNNTTKPRVYYDHQTEQLYRAALIGGDIIKDINSDYYENFLFVDFLSKELFAYDFINDDVKLIPLPEELPGFFSSVMVYPFEKDSLILASSTGYLMKVKLP
tara:strand:+ start:8621 stop:10000 length:1380 start_codon:yes stop_codon:yes gene_type:complete